MALWMVGVYVNYSIGTLQTPTETEAFSSFQFALRCGRTVCEGKIRMSPNKRPSRQGCFWVGVKPSHSLSVKKTPAVDDGDAYELTDPSGIKLRLAKAPTKAA